MYDAREKQITSMLGSIEKIIEREKQLKEGEKKNVKKDSGADAI